MSKCGCCNFSQGRKAVQALIWSIVSFVACVGGSSGCHLMRIDGFLAGEYPFQELGAEGTSRVGPLGYSRMGNNESFLASCAGYNKEQRSHFFDSNMTAVFYAAVVSLVLTSSVMAVMISSSCIAIPQSILKCGAAFSLLSSVLQGFQFLLYQSKLTEEEFGGTFFFGSITVVVAMLVSFATACFILIVPSPEAAAAFMLASPTQSSLPISNSAMSPPPPSHKRHFQGPKKQCSSSNPETALGMKGEAQTNEAFAPGTETTTETLLPDGSKKVTTTTVRSDGSKCVTETIVQTQIKIHQS